MMFLGDFIYVDFSPRLGSSTAHYNALYRETLGHPESVRFLSSTPSVAIFDDHEVGSAWV